MTKALEYDMHSTVLNSIICFAVHYMCFLAPDAVTELDYEQSNGSDNVIKITIKWMVSSQS